MDSTIAEGLGPDDPREIGPFTVIGLLGSGGMGEVYLATGDSGYVAVKRVRPRLVSGERFQREVGLLYRVPAGVGPAVLASDGTAARPWFATEYVPGLTVDEAVRLRGPLPTEALWLLLAGTAERLRAVHEAGIVHRDLKPANVMIVRDGVKLIDFGIARAADQARLTRSGGSYGTRGFTAPEQEDGDEAVASPADVYSLGALLLYAASGRTPGLVADVEPMRAADADLARVIEACLAADPAARPTAESLLAEAREHVPAAEPSWPTEMMDRIAVRCAFAATPVSRMETLPPPDLEPGPEAGAEADEAQPPPVTPQTVEDSSQGSRRSRRRVLLLPLALVLVLGGVAAFVLIPFTTPSHPAALSSATATDSLGSAADATQTSTVLPSHSASSSARATGTTPDPAGSTAPPGGGAGGGSGNGATSPGAVTTTTSAAKPAVHPTASATAGISGGDDATKVAGSEADTDWVGNDAACSAWLDDGGSGALAGVLNTSLTQSCVAELYRSDGMAYSFSASWGAMKTNFIPDTGYTMWICVWHADDQASDEACSARFGMNGTTPVKQ